MIKEISVSELVHNIKENLEYDPKFNNILVKGEVNNVSFNRFGHIYFSLKDQRSKINCVIFKNYVNNLTFKMADGLELVANGRVNVYEAGGSLQLQVFNLIEAGIGDLHVKYQLLKKQLEQEGLFNNEYKKALNKYPERIGVIAGKDSAALADIKINLARRWPLASVVTYEATVQGAQAATDIIKKLEKAESENFDVILLCRGGGSFEDLNCFNDEELIRTIFKLNTVIVSGIGHESDTTLTDYVVDLRAPTPTAAVELATPHQSEILAELNSLKYRLNSSINNRFQHKKLRFTNLENRLKHQLNKQLINIQNFRAISQKITNLTLQLISKEQNNLSNYQNQLEKLIKLKLLNDQVNFNKNIALLDAYSPLKILSRGYGIIKSGKQVVNDIAAVKINDTLDIILSNGSLKAVVKEKNNVGKKI